MCQVERQIKILKFKCDFRLIIFIENIFIAIHKDSEKIIILLLGGISFE